MAGATRVSGVIVMGLLSQAAFGQDPAPAPGKPGNAEAWYKSAYDRRHNKDLDGAIADATEAIKLSPMTGKYWLERGISRGGKGDLDGALDDFNHAVQFAPENADALRIRANMKGRMKNFDGALEDFGEAIRLSPQFSRAYGDRADTYRQMGKIDLALADYNRALNLDKKYYWFCEGRGDILRSQGKLDLAAADYRSALETAKDEGGRGRLQKKLAALANTAPPGWTALFNGKDFSGWKVPDGDNGHWKIVESAIDCDVRSEAKGEKNLWTERSFRDFILRVDWRLKPELGYPNKVPAVLPDGSHKLGEDGKELTIDIEDVDSGIFLRGDGKSQVNIWMWPVGSGEVYGYRTDKNQTPEVRAGATPKKRMDRPRGEWNTFEITLKGDRLWVRLNGEEVITNAQLPGIPPEGPIALQHHGGWDERSERWTCSPSLVQFRNLFVKELKD
ncbi:MAG TPA: family 16 glycoside hydrolase [Planctomycetota bacterium]|nr:family 16 glycoside hydrolase [Planctomycetota bacterium]